MLSTTKYKEMSSKKENTYPPISVASSLYETSLLGSTPCKWQSFDCVKTQAMHQVSSNKQKEREDI